MRILMLSLVSCFAVPALAQESADTPKWIPIFNGQNLEGWTPKFARSEYGVNLHNTFRVVDGILVVSYDEYESFDNRFGHLYYRDKLSDYRLKVEYRFIGEQTAGGPGWALRNSGVMLHCEDPRNIPIDQDFPTCIEVQFLGGTGAGVRTTANLCTPGTNVVMDGQLKMDHCLNSSSKTYHGDQWVTVEIEVHGHDVIRHLIDGQVVMEYSRPQLDERETRSRELAERNGIQIKDGYIAIQAESHPVQFRRIDLMRLPTD